MSAESLALTGALAPMDVPARADRVRAALAGSGCDALLVTGLPNVRWLTGFSGSAARVVVLADEVVLLTDGRYGEQATEEARRVGADVRVVEGRTRQAQQDELEGLCRGLRALGLEAEHVTWAAQRGYAAWFGGDLVPTDSLIEGLRLVKDAGEIARLERAAAIADAALADVVALLDEEPTEAEFALALEHRMRALGADGPSFDTIVAAGANAGYPHHHPGPQRVREGDLVVIDFGALLDGYHSDMTRTAMLGAPTPEQAEMLALVGEAEALGVAAVAPGVRAREVDASCRDTISAAGHGARFTHGTGHGVGLVIHEAPWINSESHDVLAVGQVLTVEPGVYRGALGGVRVEDCVLVTPDGCRPLTNTPKDLACLRSPRTT